LENNFFPSPFVTHVGFLRFWLGLGSFLSSSFPPLLGALFNTACYGFNNIEGEVEKHVAKEHQTFEM
jgi:hypothetical protein